MNLYELNKIAGAVFATVLLVFSLSITSEFIYGPAEPEENVAVVVADGTDDAGALEAVGETDEAEAVEAAEETDVAEETDEAEAAAATEETAEAEAVDATEEADGAEAVEATTEADSTSTSEIDSIAVRLQTADASAGKSSSKKCGICHSFDKSGPTKIGPNLYGVVGSNAARQDGFKYSAAIVEKGSEGMIWTFSELDNFLTKPKAALPGTSMKFAGLKKANERANVIAYLRSLADSPVPLP